MADVVGNFEAHGARHSFKLHRAWCAESDGNGLAVGEFVGHGLGCNKQFRPDAAPSLLAKHLSGDDTAAQVFNTAGFNGIHIPATSKALVQVLLADLELCGPSLANFGGNFVAHSPKYIESLEDCKRFDSHISAHAVLKEGMETNSERRRRKLTSLCAERGLREVADRAGLNYQSLDQVIKGTLGEPKKDGSRAPKSLGNASARAIENSEGLGLGWFDVEEDASTLKIGNDILRMQVANLAKMLEAIPQEGREVAYLAAVQSLIKHLP